MKNFFEYLETSTWQERKTIETELKELYNGALKDMLYCFSLINIKRNAKNDYLEAVQRVGAIEQVFDILHIEYENGNFFEI